MFDKRALSCGLVATALTLTSLSSSGCASGPRGALGRNGLTRVTEADVRHDARLLAMLDARRPDTLLIDTLLIDADPDRRARTALAIGQLRMRERFPHLRGMLRR